MKTVTHSQLWNIIPSGVLQNLRLVTSRDLLVETIVLDLERDTCRSRYAWRRRPYLFLMGLQFFRIDIARSELMFRIDFNRC